MDDTDAANDLDHESGNRVAVILFPPFHFHGCRKTFHGSSFTIRHVASPTAAAFRVCAGAAP
jgi:hypothetical protein